MLLKRLISPFLLLFCIGKAVADNAIENSGTILNEKKSAWQFEAGISAGRPTPIMINLGASRENVVFRIMGGGWHLDPDEFWIGYRGSVAWKFFYKLPFSIDLGLGGGYAFAKAPNQVFKALNRANHKRFVRSYNYKESLDISAEIRANIYGVFTHIGIPIYYFMKHNEPNVFWQVGYAYSF